MSTATKKRQASTVARSRQLRGLKQTGAIDMFRGHGATAYTYYDCSIIERAKQNGSPIRVVKEKGKRRSFVLTKPRPVHREDIFAKFGDTHDLAGQGKYIKNSAISKDGKLVTGYQNINPYLADEGSYSTIVEAFMSRMSQPVLKAITAAGGKDRPTGTHLRANGKRNSEDAVLTSEWLTEEQLWTLCRRINPKLVGILNKVKSQVKGAKHQSAREKFAHNLGVMRRAREAFQVVDGTRKFRGGATPYSMPLEQCDMAIDMYHLTTGIEGTEVGEYFYRLAIGRRTPRILYARDWNGLDFNSPFAYVNEKVLTRCKAVRKPSKAV